MRAVVIAMALCSTTHADPARDWIHHDEPAQHVAFDAPPGATVAAKPGKLEISGSNLPSVTIEVDDTTDGATGTRSTGSRANGHLIYTVRVPKRAARCEAHGDTAALDVAVTICKSLALQPGPRTPSIAIDIAATGQLDASSFEHAIRALQPELERCWKNATNRDHDLSDGTIVLVRDSRPAKFSAQPLTGVQRLRADFLHGNSDAVADCMFPLLEHVPAKLASTANVRVSVACSLY